MFVNNNLPAPIWVSSFLANRSITLIRSKSLALIVITPFMKLLLGELGYIQVHKTGSFEFAPT